MEILLVSIAVYVVICGLARLITGRSWLDAFDEMNGKPPTNVRG